MTELYLERRPDMRVVTHFAQHPEARKQRFPEHLWPTRADPQSMAEHWVLVEFLDACRMVPESAPQKLIPPKPDMECTIAGKVVRYELGEVLESDLAEGMNYSGKQSQRKADARARGDEELANSIQTVGGRQYPANAALERILRKKLTKPYLTDDIPTDLVLFYDTQYAWGPFHYLQQWESELATLLARSSFDKIWLFHVPDQAVIGKLQLVGNTLQAVFDHTYHFDPSMPYVALVPNEHGTDELKYFMPSLIKVK
jgi:hypothetical protein